jgi:hypothetical protein
MSCGGKGMTEQDRPLTAKQWQRRALKAEAELELVHELRKNDAKQEMAMARELAMLRVAAHEVYEVTQWALGSQS